VENSKMKKEDLSDRFRQIYDAAPRIFCAPGRINLIGEHTDYNQGFVLPFAIDREAMVAGTARSDTKVKVNALDLDDSFVFDLAEPAAGGRGSWIDYVEGTIRCLQKRFELRHGANLIFSSSVPIGAGLSSSAALEVSTGLAILLLNEVKLNQTELAFAAREAEHEFVGVRTGIMDQFASVFGKKDHALLIDCRSLGITHIPLDLAEAILVVCNTGIKHQLASSEYNTRRAECEESVELLREKMPEIVNLRDVSEADFDDFQNILPETLKRRCRHVITENARTLKAADFLAASNISGLGELMYLSHESLRDDYEVSCPELDTLVETARQIDRVYGARMTGGGFGGCTINLLKKTVFEEFHEQITQKYLDRFGFAPEVYIVSAVGGATELL
jgi:galactokinase